MTEAAFIALLGITKWVIQEAPGWFGQLKAKGELTAAGEAAYQAHQEAVFSKPEAQSHD